MDKIKFTVRQLKKQDGKDLINNYYSRYAEVRYNPLIGVGMMAKKPPYSSEVKWFNNLFKRAKSRKSVAVVAEVDGKVVGMCDIVNEDPNVEREHVGKLGIAINEGYRRYGIGTALMHESLKRSKGVFSLITLSVFHTNKPAIRLYKKFGFKIYGKLPEGYIRGNRKITGIYMYLKL